MNWLKTVPMRPQVFFVRAVHIAAITDIYLTDNSEGEKVMAHDDLRITADEVRRRISAGEEFTVIDARNPQAWGQADDMAGNAVRVDAHSHQLPQLPRDKPVVIYCT